MILTDKDFKVLNDYEETETHYIFTFQGQKQGIHKSRIPDLGAAKTCAMGLIEAAYYKNLYLELLAKVEGKIK